MSTDWGRRADRLAAEALAEGDPSGWFDRLYAAGRRGEVDLPWDPGVPHPLLAEWARGQPPDGHGRRAVVVGCGLGHDAEFVAGLGFDVVGFDVSPTAIATVRERRPGSPVQFVVADLFDLPEDWRRAFDLVVEVHTVQALPVGLRDRAVAAVAGLVAPGGTLVVVAAARDGDAVPAGPPWPLTREELDRFGADLATVRIDRRNGYWRAEFRRPGG